MMKLISSIRSPRFRRLFVFLIAVFPGAWAALTAPLPGMSRSAVAQELITKSVALQHGLERAWFTQTACSTLNTLRYLSIDDTTLLVQGSGGTLEVIDGETGQRRWIVSGVIPGGAFSRPGTSARMVAVVAGTNLYVLNRENGRLLWQIPMASAGTTAPMISNFRIITPLMDNRMATWPIIPDDEWIRRMEQEKAAMPENVAKINAEKWGNLRLNSDMGSMVDHLMSVGRTENPIRTTLRLAGQEYYVWTSDIGLVQVAQLYTTRGSLRLAPLFQTTLRTPTTRQIAWIPPKGWPEDRAEAMKIAEASKTVAPNAAGGAAAGVPAVKVPAAKVPAAAGADDPFGEETGAPANGAPADADAANGAAAPASDAAIDLEVTSAPANAVGAGNGVAGKKSSIRVSSEGVPILPPDGDLGAIVVIDENGEVYAFDQRDGSLRWRNSIRSRPLDDPAVVDRRIFANSILGGTFCIDGDSGEIVWNIEEPLRFLAASKTRLYAEDSLGRIAIRSLADGSVIDRLPTNLRHEKLVNTHSDRVYVISQDGLLQCFHEPGQDTPILRTLAQPDLPLDREFVAGLRRRDTQGKAASASTARTDDFDPFADTEADWGPAAGGAATDTDPFIDHSDAFDDDDGFDPFGDAFGGATAGAGNAGGATGGGAVVDDSDPFADDPFAE